MSKTFDLSGVEVSKRVQDTLSLTRDECININIENALASSFKQKLTGTDQRRLMRLMMAIEDRQGDVMTLSDDHAAELFKRWRDRNMAPVVGDMRRVFNALDRAIDPEGHAAFFGNNGQADGQAD